VKPLDYHGLNEIYSKSFGQMYVFLGDHYGRCDIAKGHYIEDVYILGTSNEKLFLGMRSTKSHDMDKVMIVVQNKRSTVL